MGDPVDDIREGWARIRPDLPTRSVGTITRVWRIAHQFHTERARVLNGLGIDQATLELLANLRRSPHEEPLSPSDLSQACGVTSGAISQRLRRAETAGWIVRSRHPGDARGTLVVLTDEGREATDRFAQIVLENDERLIAHLSDDELSALETQLAMLEAAVVANRSRPQRASDSAA